MLHRDNPLLNLDPDRYGRTWVEAVEALKWKGRGPDTYGAAKIRKAWAEWEIQRAQQHRQPVESYVLRDYQAPLPAKKRGRPVSPHPDDIATVARRMRPYCASPAEARQQARERLARPYLPECVKELFRWVRPLATTDEEAYWWIGEYLHLSDSRIKALVKAAIPKTLQPVS